MPTGHYQRKFRGETLLCEHCGSSFYKFPSDTKRFCSRSCAYAARQGQPLSDAHVLAKTLAARRGTEHHKWKADGVSYSGLHHWVRKNFGQADRCELCGTTETYRFEWANVTGQYRRDREDWIQLCVRCHRRLDAGHRRFSTSLRSRFIISEYKQLIEQAEAEHGARAR